MKVGDLAGLGVMSGPLAAKRGNLPELFWCGKEPCVLAKGQSRSCRADSLTRHGHAMGQGDLIGACARAGTVVPEAATPFTA